MYKYKIIPYGYEIYVNGRIFIRQINCPNHPDVELSEEYAINFAKLVIAKLSRRLSPFITEEEENILQSEDITDEIINELVNAWENR